jgi:DNA (cytosine-5)-methyltransferase 1
LVSIGDFEKTSFIDGWKKVIKAMIELNQNNVSVVDLFCGAGGLTNGFLKESMSVNAGIDFDERCKYAYEYNNGTKFITKDICKLKTKEVKALFPDNHIKILAGCAPCQPFSKYTQGNKNYNDLKWRLLSELKRLILGVEPEIVTMENVPQVTRYEIFRQFVSALKKSGYHIFWNILKGPYYGIPQTRERLVLLASKFGPIEIISPTHSENEFVTVKAAIGHLPPLSAGEKSQGDRYHRCQNLTEVNLKRIKSSKPGGTWRDWDESLILACHKKDSGSHYSSVYGRMKWDEPSPTMTTNCYNYGSGRFGHPEQDRTISLREAALLQTFPENYQFLDPEADMSIRAVSMMIGNAVPVRLGQVIAKSILKHLNGYFETYKEKDVHQN